MSKLHITSWTIACAIFFMVLTACNHKGPDQMLMALNKTIEENPQKAFTELMAINPDSLDRPSRHYRDLLIVKASDKAYIPHTSDSLIINVVNYFELLPEEPTYSEALYYAGQVYADLGDLPIALEYLQKAIDSTSADVNDPKFKRNLYSQTGRLLEELRLSQEALPYLKKAIEISTTLNDSVGVFYDMMHLIPLYKGCDSLIMANKYQIQALKYSKAVSAKDQAWLNVERASTFLHEGKIDSALIMIRHNLNDVDTLCRDYALGIAADIYKHAGMIDTAYMYAKKLVLNPTSDNRIAGYSLLLSPDLYPLIPSDSIKETVQAYTREIRANRDLNQARETMIQNAQYNYSVQVRERKKAEIEKIKAQRTSYIIIFSCLVFSFVLILFIIRIKVNSRLTEMKLNSAIQLVKILRFQRILQIDNKVEIPRSVKTDKQRESEQSKKEFLQLSYTSYKDKLRNELLQELTYLNRLNLSLKDNNELYTSPIVRQLRKLLSSGSVIKENMWVKIESAVLKISPKFKTTLMTLTLDKMTEKEYQLALLNRCGFKPKEISILISRSKTAVTDRRRFLSQKIFGETSDKGALDKLISRL